MEHNGYANGQLMATQSIDKQQHYFDKIMASFHHLMPLVVATTCLGMAQKLTLAFLESEVEKALGRPLTSYNRALCRREYKHRQVWGWLVALLEAYEQRCRDDEVIHRVVWRWG